MSVNTVFSYNAVVTSVIGLTAAGNNQASATSLPARLNVVTTVPSGSGVRLPLISRQHTVIVLNRGANTLTVYPDTSASIETNAVNAGVTLNAGGNAIFESSDPNSGSPTWYQH
jgi:hypothetical protein